MGYDTMSGGGRKRGVFLSAVLILVILVIGLVGGSMYLGSVAPKVEVSKFQAGEGFEPGAKAKIYGVDSEAYLDGLEQRVSSTNPGDKWVQAFPNGKCQKQKEGEEEKKLCSAPAPVKLNVDNSIGYKIDSVVGSFGVKGGIAGILGMLMVGGLLWVIINEISGENR